MSIEYIHQKKREFYTIERPKDILNFLSRFLKEPKLVHLKSKANDTEKNFNISHYDANKITLHCKCEYLQEDNIVFYHLDERYIEFEGVLLECKKDQGIFVVDFIRIASKTRAEKRLHAQNLESFVKEMVFPKLEFTTDNINQHFHYLEETLRVFSDELNQSFKHYKLYNFEDFLKKTECNAIISSRKPIYIEDINNLPHRFDDHFCDLKRFLTHRYEAYIDSLKSQNIQSLIIVPLISVSQDGSRHIIGFIETTSKDEILSKIKFQEFFDICQIIVESLQNKFYKRFKQPQYFLDISSRGFKLQLTDKELIDELVLKPDNFGIEIEIEPYLSVFVYVQFIRLMKIEDQFEASFEILSSPDRHGLTNWLKFIDSFAKDSDD